MNKQAEVHEKRQETKILWICFSRTENNFDNIFYRQIYQKWTIYNLEEKHGMQCRHKLRCKALKNNMAKDRCKTMSLAMLVIMFLSTNFNIKLMPISSHRRSCIHRKEAHRLCRWQEPVLCCSRS